MELKIDIWTPKQFPTNLMFSWVGGGGGGGGGGQLSVGVPKIIFFLLSLL